MSTAQVNLDQLHALCSNHRHLLTGPIICLDCERTMTADDIDSWHDDDQTALCPSCLNDVIVPLDALPEEGRAAAIAAFRERWLTIVSAEHFATPPADDAAKVEAGKRPTGYVAGIILAEDVVRILDERAARIATLEAENATLQQIIRDSVGPSSATQQTVTALAETTAERNRLRQSLAEAEAREITAREYHAHIDALEAQLAGALERLGDVADCTIHGCGPYHTGKCKASNFLASPESSRIVAEFAALRKERAQLAESYREVSKSAEKAKANAARRVEARQADCALHCKEADAARDTAIAEAATLREALKLASDNLSENWQAFVHERDCPGIRCDCEECDCCRCDGKYIVETVTALLTGTPPSTPRDGGEG